MKFLMFILLITSVSMAQNKLFLSSNNTGDNVNIDVSVKNKSILNLDLRNMLQEGINMKHRSFNYAGERYVLNIFANLNIIDKNEINKIDVASACSRNKSYRKLFDIKSEISFSISLSVIDNGYLKQIEVVENKEIIEYKKSYTYRCKLN